MHLTKWVYKMSLAYPKLASSLPVRIITFILASSILNYIGMFMAILNWDDAVAFHTDLFHWATITLFVATVLTFIIIPPRSKNDKKGIKKEWYVSRIYIITSEKQLSIIKTKIVFFFVKLLQFNIRYNFYNFKNVRSNWQICGVSWYTFWYFKDCTSNVFKRILEYFINFLGPLYRLFPTKIGRNWLSIVFGLLFVYIILE